MRADNAMAMPSFKPVTDEALIANLRRDERHRRWLGVVQAAFGLSLLAVVGALTAFFYREWTDPRSPMPVDRYAFLMGMGIGGVFAGSAFKACHLAVEGLVRAILPSRRDRLLLRLWDERAGILNDAYAAPPASVRSETTYAEPPSPR